MSYDADYSLTGKHLEEIKAVLGKTLICPAPPEEDRERNTDLVVLKMDSVRIGCRLRREKFYYNEQYRNEFTIRSSRPSKAKTELAKIIEGWGHYFFYGFAGDDGLLGWTVADLNVFRLWHSAYLVNNAGQLPGIEKPNGDGSSTLRVFRWKDLPPKFVVNQELNCAIGVAV